MRVANHTLRRFGKESLVKRGFDELCFMRRSAGHVHGERKTMAVCDGHDFAAFAAFCRAHTRAPFFAPLKLASMKDSLARNQAPSFSAHSRRHRSHDICYSPEQDNSTGHNVPWFRPSPWIYSKSLSWPHLLVFGPLSDGQVGTSHSRMLAKTLGN
jgi:hypothetical protein